MPDLVVGTNSYITLADAEIYMESSARGFDLWGDVPKVEKERALITSQRLLERQTWQGDQTAPKPGQALAWPRTGVTDRYGDAVASATPPQAIIDAQVELAFDISQDTDVEEEKDANSNTKKVVADTVEVEFFNPVRNGGRFPSIVQELVGEFLAGAGSGTSVGLQVFGTDVASRYSADDWTVSRGWP